MPVHSPHIPGSHGRAVRLVGWALLTLAVVVAGSSLLGARLGLWGRGAGRERVARVVAGDPAANGLPGSSAADDARGNAGARSDLDEVGVAREKGPGAGALGPDLARERDGGDARGGGRRRARGAEQMLAFLDEFERQIDSALALARESVVALEYTAGHASAGRRRIASGVVINASGEILSVRIDPPRGDAPTGSGAAGKKGQAPSTIVARDYRGRRHVARWVAADPHTGLTLLCVSPRAVRPIRPASDGPKLGSQVFVVGNPFGMGHSVHRGHVAGLDRVLELGIRQLGGLIQVQAPLYPGDSGAPVVDVRGEWLGLIRGGLAVPGAGRSSPATDPGSSTPSPRAAEHRGDAADAGDGEPDTDFGFAIPTRDALWIAEQLRAHGRVDRAYLGVRLETMPVVEGPAAAPEPASSAPASASASTVVPSGAWRGAAGAGSPGTVDPMPEATPSATAESDPAPVPGEGARIRDVIAGTPAAQAGLRPGDRIVSLDGQPIRSRNDLIDRLERIPARTDIVLGVVREGEPARWRSEVPLHTASRSGQPGSGPVAGPGASSQPRSAGASVAVTPTDSRAEPPEPAPSPSRAPGPATSPSGGSNPTPPPSGRSSPAPLTSGEAHPGPGDVPSPSPRQDAAPAPVPTAPDRADPVPPGPGSFNELKLTLPRAVVERIEHLERRIDELEHVRAAAGPGTGPATGSGNAGERDPRAQSVAPGPSRARADRPSGPPSP